MRTKFFGVGLLLAAVVGIAVIAATRGGGQSGPGFPGSPRGERFSAILQPSFNEDQQIDRDIRKLLDEFGKSKDETARADTRGKLIPLVGKQFDAKHARREAELQELQERVNRLKEGLERRKANKQAIVESRAQQLLQEADGLGWSTGSPNAGLSASDAPSGVYTVPAVK